MKISINRNFTGKVANHNMGKLNNTFETRDVTPEQFMQIIDAGFVYTAALSSSHRVDKNVVERWEITLDSDIGLPDTFQQWVDNEFFKENGYALVHSASSIPGEKEKIHAIFLLKKPITDRNTYKAVYQQLRANCGIKTDSLDGYAHMLFNGVKKPSKVFGNILDIDSLTLLDAGGETPSVQRGVDTKGTHTRFFVGSWRYNLKSLHDAEPGNEPPRHKKLYGLGQWWGELLLTSPAAVDEIGDPMPGVMEACINNGFEAEYGGVARIFSDGVNAATEPLPLPDLKPLIKSGDKVKVTGKDIEGTAYSFQNEDGIWKYGIKGHSNEETFSESDLELIGRKLDTEAFDDLEAAFSAIEMLSNEKGEEPSLEWLKAFFSFPGRFVNLSPIEQTMAIDALDKVHPRNKATLNRLLKEAQQTAESCDKFPSEQIMELLSDKLIQVDDMTGYVLVDGKQFDDLKRGQIMTYVRDRLEYSPTRIMDVITDQASKNVIHPVKNYFENLPEWDGIDRLSIVVDCMKLEDKFQENFVKIWYNNMVSKIFNKTQNYMLVISGNQGIGKSTIVREMTPNQSWFKETHFNPSNKDDVRRLASTMLWEFSEIQGIVRKADREALKAVIMMQNVTFRLTYGRLDMTKPVLCSMVGTMNETGNGFLSDPSNNRRYLIVRSTVPYGETFDDKWKEVDKKQFWAQVLAGFHKFGHIELDADHREKQTELNAEYKTDSPVTLLFEEFFDYDLNRTEPANSDDLNGGVWGVMQILRYLQTNGELRDSQKLNKVLLAEYLLELTGEKSKTCRTVGENSKVRKGWKHLWLRGGNQGKKPEYFTSTMRIGGDHETSI